MDSFEISLFDEVDAFYAYGRDATMDDAYADELSIVTHVKHKIFAIARTLECPIILLKSPTPENFPLIKAQCDGLHLSYDPKNCVENNTRVLVGHEQYDLYDSYILDVVHDTTENYFERGKFGYRNFHVTKTPLSKLKLSKLFLFHLPMHVMDLNVKGSIAAFSISKSVKPNEEQKVIESDFGKEITASTER